MSALRRLCLIGRTDPVDRMVYPTINARLYPGSNRCEKRLVAGSQFFDLEERTALTKLLKVSRQDRFVFVDLGANVGFYSLWLVSESRRKGKAVRILAVEPDKVTRGRLATNIAASGAIDDIAVVPCGIGAAHGRARMVQHERNRGANTISMTPDATDQTSEILPIDELCRRNEIVRIDALKIDIEGHDLAALEALFSGGHSELYPTMIIAEVGKNGAMSPLVQLCRRNGYEILEYTRLNAILRRSQTQIANDGDLDG